MIHVGRKKYPYMEEVNEGILRQFDGMSNLNGLVLDVGCGRAQLAEQIRQRGRDVWGIEQDPEACETANLRVNRLLPMNLMSFDEIRGEIGDQRFDVLVFSDVLEHLYDPRTVLEFYLEFVKPGGLLMISVPNAVVWTNRFQWLVGRVEYEDTGVMDRTHVRFFTFRTARRLVEAAGCQVIRVASTPLIVRAFLPIVKWLVPAKTGVAPNPRALIDSSAFRHYMRYIYPWESRLASLWRGMLAFRIIIVARKPENLQQLPETAP